jgi:enamine deaminase RidA (YjgF/YER057c/UK114 family)
MIEFLMVPGAPTPVALFSHVVTSNGWLFVTGQMPTDPNNDGAALPDGIEAQTRRVIENLKLVLAGVNVLEKRQGMATDRRQTPTRRAAAFRATRRRARAPVLRQCREETA